MNYYVKGDAAKAQQIKAAFKAKGIDTASNSLEHDEFLYYSSNGLLYFEDFSNTLLNVFKTNPGYTELELPVEHKFKVGDWVVSNKDSRNRGRITSVVHGKKYPSFCGYHHTGGYFTSDYEGNYHLWTIADAEDGDVLVSGIDNPFIYVGNIEFSSAGAYVGVSRNGRIRLDMFPSKAWTSIKDVKPATKEQRDLLFAKLREAGYEWDAGKKELRKIIEPNFKAGDVIKTGNTIDTIAEIDYATHSYYCESGRTIWFENQDLWRLVSKPHHDIANFKPFDRVLVRQNDANVWGISLFSRCEDNEFCTCNNVWFNQCIPFNDKTKHLLGTTDMCPEEYINW